MRSYQSFDTIVSAKERCLTVHSRDVQPSLVCVYFVDSAVKIRIGGRKNS